MPKYYDKFIIHNYYLYFTSHCILEAFHVHASNKKLLENGSAKFFVYDNGDTKVEKKGTLTDKELKYIREFIKVNYKDMYDTWKKNGGKEEYYNKR